MQTFIKNLAEGINAPELAIRESDKLAELPNWDSLAMLTTLSMLDMEYGVTLSGTELQNCTTVADLHELTLKKKGSIQ